MVISLLEVAFCNLKLLECASFCITRDCALEVPFWHFKLEKVGFGLN